MDHIKFIDICRSKQNLFWKDK